MREVTTLLESVKGTDPSVLNTTPQRPVGDREVRFYV